MANISNMDVEISYYTHNAINKILKELPIPYHADDITPKYARVATGTVEIMAMAIRSIVTNHRNHGKSPWTAEVADTLLTQTLNPFVTDWAMDGLAPEERAQFAVDLLHVYQQCAWANDRLEAIFAQFHGTEILEQAKEAQQLMDRHQSQARAPRPIAA